MFKLFRNIGFITLILVSFIYTQKLVSVVKEYDDLMIKIKDESIKYEIKPIEATIQDKTIIPGLNGKTIDIENSYTKMKQYGKYDEGLLVYQKKEPISILKNNLDKYIISGNKSKKMVSIIIKKIDDNIINLLNTKNIKVNFFINNEYINNNENRIIELITNNYLVGSVDNNENNIIETTNIIKKIGHQLNGYCYTEEYNEEVLKKCSIIKNYTIIPNLIIKNNEIDKLEKNITNGSIITLSNIDVTSLNLIINFIQNKGYNIVTLDKLLDESN